MAGAASIASLAYFGPELALVAGVMALLVVDLIVRPRPPLAPGEHEWAGTVALVAVAAAFVLAKGVALPAFLGGGWLVRGLTGMAPGWLFGRTLVLDNFAVFFKLLLALAALGVVLMSIGSREVRGPSEGEYYALLVAATLGMFLMAAAAHLLMAYLALEFVSLTSYVLAGYLRHNRRSGEAALKYLIYGGVASGTMIFGMSWIFGLAGTLDYAGIHTALASGSPDRLVLLVALVLVLVGFGYKITAVPFHMWAPDVYTGAPLPVTAFLAVASKAAGFAMLIRFFYPAISTWRSDGLWHVVAGVGWPDLLVVISIATMTLGNLAALQQRNLKRLLAYSSIAHAGYMLMGVVVLSDRGLQATLFYLVVYYIMNLGAFWVVMIVANSTGREDIDGYRGLAWRGGAAPALALAVFLFSLTGIPPLAGFVGKFYLFAAVIEARYYVLALVGLLNSVVSLYYYARVVKAMFLDRPAGDEAPVSVDWMNAGGVAVLCLATLYLGVGFGGLLKFAALSARFFAG